MTPTKQIFDKKVKILNKIVRVNGRRKRLLKRFMYTQSAHFYRIGEEEYGLKYEKKIKCMNTNIIENNNGVDICLLILAYHN